MADYKIRLGVELDTRDIGNQISGIKPSKPIQIGVELDNKSVQSVQNDINKLRTQLQQLGNVKINLGNRIGNIGKNISNNMSQVTASIENTKTVTTGLEAALKKLNFDAPSITFVTQQLDKMGIAVTKVQHRISGDKLRLNVTGVDDLGRTVTVLKEVDLAAENVSESVKEISRTTSQTFGRTREEAQQTNAAYREMKSLIKDMHSTSLSIDQARDAGQSFEALEQKLISLNARYDELETNFAGGFDANQTRNIAQAWDDVGHSVNIALEKMNNARVRMANDIGYKFKSDDFNKQIKLVESDINRLSKAPVRLKAAFKELENSKIGLNNAISSGDIEEIISANERYETALKKVKNQLDINKRAEQDSNKALKLDDRKALFSSKIDKWLSDNSAAVDRFGSQMLDLKARIKDCDAQTLNHLEAEFKQLDRAADVSGKKMQTFGDRLKAQFSKYSSYLSVATVFMYTGQALRDMFEQVVAIDSAMTELKKVTNETDATYNKFLTNASQRASDIGTTVDGLISSTADFARLGFEFTEAQGLAEVANIYAVVGDEIDSVETATQSLISTLTAFKDEAGDLSDSEFALEIVDKMNEVSNNFAISSGGIGEALARSASSMQAANNSLDETIALITAANTVVVLCHAA